MKKPAAPRKTPVTVVSNQPKPPKPRKLGGPILVTMHSKHSAGGSPKHRHHAPKHNPAPKKKRGFSPGWDVACCSAQAVGTLLGLSDAEVLDLYWLTADDPDEGATIPDTLEAAFAELRDQPGYLPGVILGVTLPESHAIAVAADGTWWSWGEPFNPAAWPGLVVEEAWALP